MLSKDLKWLDPYLENVQDLVPFDRIKKIAYYQTRSHQKNVNHVAITHKLGNNKTHNIYIRTNLPKEKRIPLSYDNQEDILIFLAHELAHCCYGGWEHGPRHVLIMSQIFSKFGETLYQIGFEKDRNK